ncbi:mavicyanin-like [Pyrus x bretschneideri]|uniref:mavicyanin-like n=1 Tax=Pyrus x bretschneideri TaxID=225117 RepID=UPI00202F81E7|nr:mavicyanin-like [Pyrus x bretschneideri]
MALRNTVAVSFIMMMVFFGACSTTVYTDGGDLEGSTSSDVINYNEWALSKEFHVGDEFIFNYTQEEDFVMLVTQEVYDNCIPSLALSHYGALALRIYRPLLLTYQAHTMLFAVNLTTVKLAKRLEARSMPPK